MLPFATWLRNQERLCLEEKGERTLAGGNEKVPHGFELTGVCGTDTAGGAGSLNHRLPLLFLRYSTPDWAEGEGRTACICGYAKGLVF